MSSSSSSSPGVPEAKKGAGAVGRAVSSSSQQQQQPARGDGNDSRGGSLPDETLLLERFFATFNGEFDNYAQFVDDQARGLYPREGGGHEHIHCSLARVARDTIFAKYYFNGDPTRIFRTRLYRVFATGGRHPRRAIEMRIYRMADAVQRQIKQARYDATQIDWAALDTSDNTWLRGCEVFWYGEAAATAAAAAGAPPADGMFDARGFRFHGWMERGGCTVFSPEICKQIHVYDELLLTDEHLWVNDRAFDDDDQYVYGNQRGVPYKMRRVHGPDAGDPLWWTVVGAAPSEQP